MNNLALKSIVKFMGDLDIESLSFQDVRNWKDHLLKTRSQNTVRGYIIKLRVVMAYMQKRGYKVLDPDIIGVPKRDKKPVDFLSENDVRRLIEAAYEPRTGISAVSRHKNRAIISLLYASGVRVSELTRIDRADLKSDGTFTVIGKGGKPRLCFFDPRTEDYLRSYLELRKDNHPALFTSEQTQDRISPGTIQEMFRNARIRAGFSQPVHPHTMRHSYATNLLRNNTNLVYVRDFLGHTSVQTTEMYTHVVNEDLKRIYNEKHTV